MEGAECTTATLRNLADYFEFQKSRQADHAADAGETSPRVKLPSGILPAESAFRLLAEFGIPIVPTVLTRNADEAAAAAERMGFPIALKVESAQITHKSDVGGVALKLSNAAEVRDAHARMLNLK